MTKIYYYISPSGENPVSDFLDSLSSSQQSKIIRIFSHIKESSLGIHISNVKKLSGTVLWEIRTLGQDNIRIIYAIIHKGNILLLHGFFKKKNKTPQKELNTAMNRYREWLTQKKSF